MLPTLVLVGRPNVGKSTLFNRLTRSRDALVADLPGLTRDRHYGRGRIGSRPYLLVDTGGFEPAVDTGILHAMAQQTLQALDEADAVIFLTDARLGLTPQDREIAHRLRRLTCPVVLAINKTEGMRDAVAVAEFHELALGKPWAISSSHGEGVAELIEAVLAALPSAEEAVDLLPDASTAEITEDADVDEASGDSVSLPPSSLSPPEGTRGIRFAIIGRPNVGKSTLVNRILGEERVITFDQPGTTRDAIAIPFERTGRQYVIVDTAGVRRRARVDEAIEKFSVIKTLQAIEAAHVVVLVLDARQDISEQDAHLASYALESGRAMVLAINKWDKRGLVNPHEGEHRSGSAETAGAHRAAPRFDDYARAQVKQNIARRLGFLDFARHHYISALDGSGVSALLKSIDAAYQAAWTKLSTPNLTRAVQLIVQKQAPPRAGIVRPRLKYAHQGGSNPPRVVIHGTALEHLPTSYLRYLEQSLLRIFRLEGTPLRVELRASKNPYDPQSATVLLTAAERKKAPSAKQFRVRLQEKRQAGKKRSRKSAAGKR